ncbi:hypothetical protein WJX81_002804 [Elliptochloris bilobata]|uniref:Uncharacterized protein n=1 Tax=Elliptochloris bilobata TaxID=381761 RepID=A0AAW1S842_9CHLO
MVPAPRLVRTCLLASAVLVLLALPNVSARHGRSLFQIVEPPPGESLSSYLGTDATAPATGQVASPDSADPYASAVISTDGMTQASTEAATIDAAGAAPTDGSSWQSTGAAGSAADRYGPSTDGYAAGPLPDSYASGPVAGQYAGDASAASPAAMAALDDAAQYLSDTLAGASVDTHASANAPDSSAASPDSYLSGAAPAPGPLVALAGDALFMSAMAALPPATTSDAGSSDYATAAAPADTALLMAASPAAISTAAVNNAAARADDASFGLGYRLEAALRLCGVIVPL